MGNTSSAVAYNDISAIVGYAINKGYFNLTSPNLPQNISILAEANTANQSGLSALPFVATNAVQVAATCGYGSPAYSIARILFNANVSVPVIFYPQLAAGGAVAKVITITPTGTATANGTIYLNIAGREQIDGQVYAINVVTGDTPTLICDKMRTAIAAVLGCPVLGTGTATFVGTAKWTGLSSNDISISVDLGLTSLGTTYAVVNTTAGSGTPAIGNGTGGTTGLDFFGNAWNTIVINSYGFVTATVNALEAYNGVPDPVTPTGQYAGTIWRPMWAFTGTTLDDPTSLTGAAGRKNQVTIVPCVAPLSLGMPYEAAANAAALWANVAQNTPHLDILEQAYPDMPPAAAGSFPQMSQYAFRQTCVMNGCSTVDYVDNVYVVKDFVTTYNTAGEFPPFYRYVRDLNLYFNYKFGYKLLQKQKCTGKALVPNATIVDVDGVVKPKTWAADLAAFNIQCERKAWIVNVETAPSPLIPTNESIEVSINGSNPNRLDTVESIYISGYARICATVVTGGFNFGS